MSLVVLVPSKGRPESALRLAKAFEDTCAGPTTVRFVIEGDDPRRSEYLDAGLHWDSTPPGAPGIVRPLNHAAEYWSHHCDYIGFLGDDHLPRTIGWDQELVSEIKKLGEFGFAYGNDLLQGENLPSAVIMSSNIVRTLGYMVPPTLKHLYADNFWKDLGTVTTSLAYRDDVIIEHLHFTNGKSVNDETYDTANASNDHDRRAYLLYSQMGLSTDAVRLKALRPTPPEYQSEGLGDF